MPRAARLPRTEASPWLPCFQQMRSIWLPRNGTWIVCNLFAGLLLAGIATSTSAERVPAMPRVLAAIPAAWALGGGALWAARRAEEWWYQLDDDDRADRSAVGLAPFGLPAAIVCAAALAAYAACGAVATNLALNAS